MRFATIFRILGILIMLFSLTMIPPLGLALWFNEPTQIVFALVLSMTLLTGFICWAPFYKHSKELKIRDGFLIVVLFWSVLSLFGSLPFILSTPYLTFTDALFESVSGFTTTGATVITSVDLLPDSLLYYRQQLQFLGGMGIIVLAVAILPMLGIGGLQLYRAETPGPSKDNKLTPRIAETAKALWYIYAGLTVSCALLYWICGMPLFDAVGESFSTVATGGFSMHDNSFEFYNNHLIYVVGVIFMILGGTNFALIFAALQKRNIFYLWQDQEFRIYIRILFFSAFMTSVVLISYQIYKEPTIAISKAIFNAVSLGTTTGFTSAPFQSWPTFIPIMLMAAGMIGGCAASTGGGIKVVRLMLLYQQGIREIKRLIHPNGVFMIKLGKTTLAENMMQAIWGFIAIYFVLFMLLILVLMATGVNFETAFGSIIASLANVGVGIGDVADNFAGLNDYAKWILIFSMLAGRLEIFTLLVLFMPDFWKK